MCASCSTQYPVQPSGVVLWRKRKSSTLAVSTPTCAVAEVGKLDQRLGRSSTGCAVEEAGNPPVIEEVVDRKGHARDDGDGGSKGRLTCVVGAAEVRRSWGSEGQSRSGARRRPRWRSWDPAMAKLGNQASFSPVGIDRLQAEKIRRILRWRTMEETNKLRERTRNAPR